MKKALVLFLALLMSLSLAGCGKSGKAEKPQAPQDGPLSYIGENKGIFTPQALPLDSRFYITDIAPGGDGFILRGWENEQDKLLSYSLREENCMELEFSGSLLPGSMSYDSQGLVSLLCMQADGSYSIMTIKPDLSIQTVDVQAGAALDDSPALSVMPVPGGFLLETYTGILYLDSKGELIKELIQAPPAADISIVHTSAEPAIVISSGVDGTKLKVYDQDMKLKAEYSLQNSYSAFFPGRDTIYARDSSAIFTLDYSAGQRQAYVSTTASGMFPTSFVVLDGFIYTAHQGRLARWVPAEGGDTVMLKMAVYGESMVVSQLVNSYNRSSAQQKIELTDYSSFNTADSPEQGIMQLHLDLVNGNGPDIIELSAFHPGFYAAKGILADLGPFFEADRELSPEDLNPALAGLGSFDGGFYELSPSFRLYTAVCDKRLAEDGLTLDRFSALAGEYGMETLFGPGLSRLQFLENCLMFDRGLVDYENACCAFDSESFVNMLELSSQLPAQPGQNTDGLTAAYTGQSRLAVMDLSSDTVGMVCYLDTVFGGDARFVGFPVQAGSGTAAIPSCRFGICAVSSKPAEAWDFISFLLSDAVQNDRLLSPGLPVVSTAMGQRMAELARYYQDDRMSYHTSVDGAEVKIPPRPADGKTLSKIEAMAAQMDTLAQVDGSIMAIVAQESERYYAGQQSAQEAARQIQSRVSIYLAEQYG